ncbi:ATPase, T2SS/T4P/T4SS family [Vibrio parahaemolyticus]|nr:ATPase, T2SS/T4P/T4SS family [Vibrio parahaemolyticus]
MGSGKSSLVYALLEKVDRIARNVHSLEDPVEFSQDFVSKTQVQPSLETFEGSGVKMDYAFYCKETLRHDVDISNIGEIRDTPTAAEFCRKAETGGLALATLHTNSALGVAQTFIQQLKMPAAIVGAPDLMAMFVHVKLVRKLCDCAFSFADRDSEEAKKRTPASTVRTSWRSKSANLKSCAQRMSSRTCACSTLVAVTSAIKKAAPLVKMVASW